MGTPLLEVTDLRKYFPIHDGIFRTHVADVKAVDGITFTIAPGEVVGLVGESGSGKTTAGRAAVRLIEPSAGKILFNGEDLSQMTTRQLREKRKDIQFIFQDPYASLNPRKTLADNIGEALLYHKMVANHREKEERVVEALQQVGLSPDTLNRYPHQFSGGQQQRVCIARAIILKPKLIICDEAVSALDLSVQAQVLNLLKDLKEKLNLSYLFISHDLSVVRHICDRVLVMYLGKVVESATCEDLFTRPKHPYTQALLESIPVDHPSRRGERTGLEGELPSSIDPPSGCVFHTRCPYAEDECRFLAPPRQVIPSQTEPGSRCDQEYFCILD